MLSEHEVKQYSPLSLAFLGDGVYSLLVRDMLLTRANMPIGKLHKESVSYVRASYQAKAVDLIYDILTDNEKDILRRGRNSHTVHVPKGSDREEYSKSTALEALFGYLHLCGDKERICYLFDMIINNIEAEKE
ncbi:MAG: ribonuclease III [Oscillospiraceae bacterium]|nr:ribonuclease III [Oscillospiraceae bacterium]